MPAFEDLSGRRFGLLVVQPEYEKRLASNRLRTFWKVLCDCGEYDWAQINMLKCGHKKSCGCLWDSTQPHGQADLRVRWTSYRASAKRRGISWELSESQFAVIGAGNCHYCGDPAVERQVRDYLNGGSVFNGIDRIDSSGPYAPSNCVPCCSRCNRLKGDLPYDEFISWCRRIAENFKEYICSSTIDS